ncbi:MAG: Nif3-like dinuclear metal center hexameric protein [Bacteroidota bacterium]
MKLKNLIHYLEEIAPPHYQESYDNSGLIVGDKEQKIKGVLTCLDSTEAVLEEAIQLGFNVVVAHHPIVFKGLKSITGRNYVERVILKAIKNDIAIYAIHTNLDNMYAQGVNTRIAEQLSLKNTQILAPKVVDKKLTIFVPATQTALVRKTFADLPMKGDFASLGVEQAKQASIKIELNFALHQESAILRKLSELSEQIALQYEISEVRTASRQVGSGMIGDLRKEVSAKKFLTYLKEKMQVEVVRHTALLDRKIKRVAVCGGAGGFLLKHAIRQKADIFITADYKYHEFFDADGNIVIADIGHYESEQFTVNLLQELISKKFTTFAAHSTTIRTNPVFYS